jgi:hypothetical protein
VGGSYNISLRENLRESPRINPKVSERLFRSKRDRTRATLKCDLPNISQFLEG